jgi:hypothetical protein
MGECKEYHVWDALTIPMCKNWTVDKVKNQQDHLRKYLQVNTNNYFNYFSDILKLKDITGDITPSYALLSKETYSLIKTNFNKIGIDVKVVFLIRDPVERIISSYNYEIKENLYLDKYKDNFIEFATLPGVELRTRYERTYKNLFEVFDKEKILVIKYEDLFTTIGIKTMSDFLNIQFIPDMINKRVNSNDNDNSIKLDNSVLSEIKSFYSETYNFLKQL